MVVIEFLILDMISVVASAGVVETIRTMVVKISSVAAETPDADEDEDEDKDKGVDSVSSLGRLRVRVGFMRTRPWRGIHWEPRLTQR